MKPLTIVRGSYLERVASVYGFGQGSYHDICDFTGHTCLGVFNISVIVIAVTFLLLPVVALPVCWYTGEPFWTLYIEDPLHMSEMSLALEMLLATIFGFAKFYDRWIQRRQPQEPRQFLLYEMIRAAARKYCVPVQMIDEDFK
jgi:hypothetical protein